MNPNIYKLSEMTKEQYDFVMKRAETDISEHMKVAKEVSDDIKKRGDVAVLEYTEKFDHVKLTAENMKVTAEEIEAMKMPTMTVEKALERAIKYSPALKDLEDTLDYLKESDEKIYDRIGSVKIPSYEYKKWTSEGMHTLVSSVYQLDSGIKQAKLGEKVQKMALEVTVKSMFSNIKKTQDNLELVKKNAAIQQKLFEQGYTKYRLGMLSKYNLDQLQVAAEQAKGNAAMLEATLEQTYIKFNNIIGENPNTRFEFIYDVTFEPYTMTQSIDQYVHSALKEDLSIQIQELTTDAAKFKKNYRNYEAKVSTDDADTLDYDKQKRALKTAKENKELLIRNAYLQLGQMETMYASAQADLNKAQANYRVAQVNLQAGNVTKTVVEQAEMGVISAQNALNEIVYNYDMLVYTFENPCLLSGNTGAAQ